LFLQLNEASFLPLRVSTADPYFDESLYGSLGKPTKDLLSDQSVQVRQATIGA
jgi:hypothetical protein